MDNHCDYVVVGTGSTGAVVANRLSADSATEVVALEAGPGDTNRFISIPAAFPKLYRSEVDWDYVTEPQPELAGRQIYWPRGKVLGGSSSMNAMMWVRGFGADYDQWAKGGFQWSSQHLDDGGVWWRQDRVARRGTSRVFGDGNGARIGRCAHRSAPRGVLRRQLNTDHCTATEN